MEIKRLQQGEEQLAEEVIKKLKSEDAAEHNLDSDFSYLQSFLKNPQNYLYAAFDNNEPVGFTLAYELDRIDTPKPMMLFYEIVVAENLRGKGIAKEMISMLKKDCARKDVMKMWLLANKSNDAAVNTYKSTGAELIPGEDLAAFIYNPESFNTK
jgi:aminoglycoside 3-N-acetyltransferase I